MTKLTKEVKKYIRDSFYKTTGKQGFLVYHRVEDDTIIDNATIKSLVRMRIEAVGNGGDSLKDSLDGVILAAVPLIRRVIYKPIIGGSNNHLIDRSSVTLDYNLNTYKPSIYQIETLEQGGIPDIFDCYLKRLFPDDNIRMGFLYWLAGLIHKPHELYGFAPVLVGASGTGKSFLIDSIIKPLLGDSNYQRISMHQLSSKFDIGVSTTSLIFCDELKKGAGVNNNLLNLIGNQTIAVENKGEDVRTEKVTASFIFSSNFRVPFDQDENLRRRMKLLPYIEHKDSVNETARFIGDLVKFIESDDGLMRLSEYLLKLSKNNVGHNRISQLLTVKHEVTMEEKTLKAVIEAGDIVFTENIKTELGIPKDGNSAGITKVLKNNGYESIGSRHNPATSKKSRCWRISS